MKARVRWIEPELIEPPHEVRDRAKLARLIDAMNADERWTHRPLLAIEDPVYGYVALTGSHRIAAAREVWAEIPVVVVDGGRAARRGLTVDLVGRQLRLFFRGRMLTDEDEKIAALRAIGDRAAARLMQMEIEANR